MPIRNIDGLLEHLEKEAGDDLAYLEATGAEYFTSAQLLRLRGQWEIKNLLFRQFQKGLLRIVAASPLWLGGWYLFRWLELEYLALLSLPSSPSPSCSSLADCSSCTASSVAKATWTGCGR